MAPPRRLKVYSDLAATGYEMPGHPEAPFRVGRSLEHLKAAGFEISPPDRAATAADVLSAHSPEHWEALCKGDYFDPDTPAMAGMDRYALISLSGALSACESARKGVPAFSLMRPPGHHAGPDRIAGFCYVNNMAVACLKALQAGLKVVTLDVDVHHGDGTEAFAMDKEDWLFISLHQSPLYPGTGLASKSNCINLPLAPETGEDAYFKVLEKAVKMATDFKPDLLAVSAGFDTFKRCPLAQLRLEPASYLRMGRLFAATGLKRFAVLEGGYAPELPVLIENFLRGFSGEAAKK